MVLLSALEHYLYCPRQCALIPVDGYWTDNAHTVAGTWAHRRVDTAPSRRERGRKILRGIPLYSERYGLSGRADAIELHYDGSVVPIEYKAGVSHGQAADVQLCAQGLCLEEMLGRPVSFGFVWYGGPRRRVRVDFTPSLRAATTGVIEAIRRMIQDAALPPAVADSRCKMSTGTNMPSPGCHQTRIDTPLCRARGAEMRVMRTLYINDHKARVRWRRGTLLVEQPSGWQRVPVETLDGVVLTGRAEISNDALGELVRRGIRIAALSKTGRLRFAVGGPVSGNVHLRIAQYRKAEDPEISAAVARWIVAGKLQNCRRAMQRWLWEASGSSRSVIESEVEMLRGRIQALAGATDGDKIRGIEGDGSRRYFKCLGIHIGTSGEFAFRHRNRRPPRDPINAILSFGYGLVLAELVGAIDAIGLDPQIGFLHRPRSGRASLALDLLEELRPAVADRFAVAVLLRQQVSGEDFQFVGGACYLSDRGRSVVLRLYEDFRSEEVHHPVLARLIGRWAVPTVQATLMARHIRGDLPVYPPFLVAA